MNELKIPEDIEKVELDSEIYGSLKASCRFCGQCSKEMNFPLNNIEFFSLDIICLMNLLELHSELNQYFSDLICEECLNQLTSFGKFKMQCKAAEARIMTNLGIPIKTEEIKLELESEENIEPPRDSDNEIQEMDSTDDEDSDYKPLSQTKKSRSNKPNKSIEEKDLKCHFCEEVFEDPALFKKHKRIHKKSKSEKKSTECNICQKVFPTFRGLSNHKLAHRRRDVEGFVPKKRPEAMCEQCGLKFQTPSGLIKHNQTKHLATNELYPCDECPKKFLNMIALKSHKSNTHKIENSTCQICLKTYKNKMLLRLHSRFHDETKRIFKCEYCPEKAGFFTKSDLKKHIRSHFGEKPYNCLYCEKRYASNRQLKNHKASVHPETAVNA